METKEQTKMSERTLDGMAYADIQKMAKNLGIRANQKADKLKRSILQHNRPNGLPQGPTPSVKKHVRRGTFDKEEAEMGSLTPNISEPRVKFAQLPSNKRTKENLQPQRVPIKAVPDRTKIPLPSRVLVNNEVKRGTTPNFARMHSRIFEKMDSLDDYVQKKKSRIDQLQNLKNAVVPPAKIQYPPAKKPQISSEIFKPTVLSVKDANFKFATTISSQNKLNLRSRTSKIPTAVHQVRPIRAKEKPTHQALFKKMKNKDTSNARSKMRECVSGVRTNRRFELQMLSRARGNK